MFSTRITACLKETTSCRQGGHFFFRVIRFHRNFFRETECGLNLFTTKKFHRRRRSSTRSHICWFDHKRRLAHGRVSRSRWQNFPCCTVVPALSFSMLLNESVRRWNSSTSTRHNHQVHHKHERPLGRQHNQLLRCIGCLGRWRLVKLDSPHSDRLALLWHRRHRLNGRNDEDSSIDLGNRDDSTDRRRGQRSFVGAFCKMIFCVETKTSDDQEVIDVFI